MNPPEPLATKCFYREKGVECESGYLFYTPSGEAVLVEGTGVYCPACDGKGMILTNKGRELLAFLEKFGRPFLRDIMDEIGEERG